MKNVKISLWLSRIEIEMNFLYRVYQNSMSHYSGLDIRTTILWIWCEWDVAIWSGLVKTLKQISWSDQNKWYISRHPNCAQYSSTLNFDLPCISDWLSEQGKCGLQYMDSLPSLPSLTCPRLVVVLSQRVLVSGSQQNPSVRSRGPADHRALLESPYLGLGQRPGTLSNDQPVTGSAHWGGQGWRVRPDHCRGPAPWFMSLSMSCFDCVLPPDSPRL